MKKGTKPGKGDEEKEALGGEHWAAWKEQEVEQGRLK